MSKLILHHLRFSRGNRIFWLLEELGLSYDVVVHYFPPKGAHATSLKEVTHLSKAPALIIGDKTWTESGAIISHLLSVYPHSGLESSPSESSTFWGYFSEGSLMLFIQPARFIQLGRRELKADTTLTPEMQSGADAMNKWFQGWSAGHVQLAVDETEAFLKDHKWFSGNDNLGVGDFMMFFPVNALSQSKSHVLGPGITGWLERVRARPAFKRAMERQAKEEKAQMDKSKL